LKDHYLTEDTGAHGNQFV